MQLVRGIHNIQPEDQLLRVLTLIICRRVIVNYLDFSR